MRKIGKIALFLSNFLLATRAIAADSVNLTPPSTLIGSAASITIASASAALIQIALVAAFVLAFTYFIWGAIDWIKSGGGKEDVGKAQGKITAAAIGMVVALGAWAALKFVGQLVGITDPSKGLTIPNLYP